MADALDTHLLARLRAVLSDDPVTEAELRALVEEADLRARALRTQVEESEQRLERLAADPASSLTEVARELRRIELLHPTLIETELLLGRLETRARELRTGWLLDQTAIGPPPLERP